MANPTVRVGFLGDASQLARESRRAQESLDQVSRHAHTTSTALGTALGTVAGRGIGAIAEGAKRAVGSVSELASTSIEAAGAMEESLHKNERVFGSSASVITAWAADSRKNILLTRQAAIEGAGGIGNLLTSWGVAQPEAAKLSTSLVGLAQDLSSFAHISQDDAFTALRSGLAGQARGLRQYGVDLSATRVQAEAYALGLAKPVKSANAIKAANVAVAAATAHLVDVQAKHGKGTLAAAQAQTQLTAANDRLKKAQAGHTATLTAAQTVQARYSLIMKGTRTIQGDAARESGTYANQTRILHKNISDLEVTIGQKLLPHALDLTSAISGLVKGFDEGTGAGGRLREDLGKLGETAKGIGDDLKPVLGVARWFVEHPGAFKLAAEGLGAYWVASKAAAIWNARLATAAAAVAVQETAVAASATAAAAGETAVAEASAGAAAGIEGVGAAATLALPEVALLSAAVLAVYETWKTVSGAISQFKADNKSTEVGTYRLQHFREYGDPNPADGPVRMGAGGVVIPDIKDTTTRADRNAEDRFLHQRAGANRVAPPTAARIAAKTRADADTTAKAQKYAADQAAAIAKRKADAAAALQAATDKLRDALQSRLDTAKGIRDSLVSSNSIVRDGVSWTAKDLLARFTVTMGKVKRFQTALSSLVARGFDPEIVSQVAAAGVQGGLGTAVGLAHASSAQVRQINATQRAISKAAGGAGNAVASMTPININAKLVIGNKELQLLTTEVSRQSARNGYNGSRLSA